MSEEEMRRESEERKRVREVERGEIWEIERELAGEEIREQRERERCIEKKGSDEYNTSNIVNTVGKYK